MDKKIQQVEIGLTSPKQIKEWAERELPNGEIVGEVTSWETVNYKTLKPEPNGLFCQRIFGPVVDYSCACGKKSNKIYKNFCLKCGVERTSSRVRRYRLGYIKFKQPIVHTLYATHKPSPLSLCLDWSNKRIQSIIYSTEFCKLPTSFTYFVPRILITRYLFEKKILITKKKFKQKNSCFFYQSKINFLFDLQPVHRKFLYLESANSSTINISKRKKFKPKLFRNLNKKGAMNFANSAHSDFYSYSVKNKSIGKLNDNVKNKHQNKIRKIETDFRLYGVTYDSTWRQVENIQKFLLFLSEQAKSYEISIPYYNFKRLIKNNTNSEIPLHQQFYPIQTGGFVFQQILSQFEILPILQQLRVHHYLVKNHIIYLQEKLKWYTSGEEWEIEERSKILKKVKRLNQYQKNCVKRLQYFRDFYNTEMNPAWMILSYLPVLPPGLRPIMSIQGQLIVSDLNSLYRKVLTRNKRVTSVTLFKIFDTALSGSWASWCYNLRQVQEAVDSLFKKGSVESGKTTKSLLESLKGKKGRFRQHLLGKRVDYSGRSVIVVGPTLKIYECGLPKQMALELFQPFLIQKLRNKRIALTTIAAKTIITEKKPLLWSLLAEIMKNNPVLLNRAPTLHRLGIQAFLPRLVEGKAILLHPLVCPAFNADFDGDQMAVHIPLGAASRSEAFHLMWSRNHLLAPASGQPLLLPTQDMVLGCYYLTIFKNLKLKDYKINLVKRKNLSSSGYYFSSLNQVQQAYEQARIQTHTPIWVRWFGLTQNFISEQESKYTEQPIECRINIFGESESIFNDRHLQKLKKSSDSFYSFFNEALQSNFKQNFVLNKNKIGINSKKETNNLKNNVYIRTTPGRVFFHSNFPIIKKN